MQSFEDTRNIGRTEKATNILTIYKCCANFDNFPTQVLPHRPSSTLLSNPPTSSNCSSCNPTSCAARSSDPHPSSHHRTLFYTPPLHCTPSRRDTSPSLAPPDLPSARQQGRGRTPRRRRGRWRGSRRAAPTWSPPPWTTMTRLQSR